MTTQEMRVTKRDGTTEKVSYDKIRDRIINLSGDLKVSPYKITQITINGLFDGIQTSKLDELAASHASSLATSHPDYGKLASRIIISNMHKNTLPHFSDGMWSMYTEHKDKSGNHVPLLSEKVYEFIVENKDELDEVIDDDRDYLIDYFGYKTLERSYLGKVNGEIVERPQYMFMRVAIGIHYKLGTMDDIIQTYDGLSMKKYIHATPTLFNAGTPRPQMSSCYLIAMVDDSIEGIYDTLKMAALISKYAGGIGISVHPIRAKKSMIRGTNGESNGLVPMLKVYNETAAYVDQCFAEDTIVYTSNGPLQICQITPNMQVVTNDGTLQNVLKVYNTSFDGQLYQLNIKQSLEPIKVTENHPFLALKNQQKGVNFSVIKNRLDRKLAVPEYVSVKDLDENCLLAIPIPQYVHDIPDYSDEECRMYGIMCGDGHISKNKKEFYVSLNNTTKLSTLAFVKQYLNDRLIHFTETINDCCVRITWWSNIMWKFSRNMLYDNDSEKIIHSCMLHLPKEKSLQLIKGLLETDGCIYKEITLEMCSRNVIESVKYILLRLGIGSSGYIRDRRGNVSWNRKLKPIITTKISYVLRIPKVKLITDLFGIESGKYVTYLRHGEYIYSRVISVTPVNHTGNIIDLVIENNHNYLTHCGLAHNGGGRRKGSFAIYLEPWHADIESFLELRKKQGSEKLRARDLFYAMWVPDLFMKRVEKDEIWSLMCPDQCPGLYTTHSEEFEQLYTRYEKNGQFVKQIKARELYKRIIMCQIEEGLPYMLFKDSCNRKSNQKNLGTIRSSNLCAEIIEYSSPEECSVCNLASISLPACLVENSSGGYTFDYNLLYKVTRRLTYNLNNVIDMGYYPVPQAKVSNMRHRPIGIGVQGLANVFARLKLPFTSLEAKKINRRIFETMYYAALRESNKLARKHGSYSSFNGSPASKGILQYDMWDITPSDQWNWIKLKKNIIQYGLRNSLLIALMPTASTSQILGNNECLEPFTTNIYTRRTLAGEFTIINKDLVHDLISLDLWSDELKDKILYYNGSLQKIKEIPSYIKEIYKTV